MFKRFIGIMMSALMAFSASTSAFAAESADVSNDTNIQEVDTVSTDASDRALGKILASGVGTINNGIGTVTAYLPSSHSSVYILAQVGYSSVNVPVSCSVTTPDGNTINLGTISGTGDTTYTYPLSYAPRGNYVFKFTSANTSPYNMVVMIRE